MAIWVLNQLIFLWKSASFQTKENYLTITRPDITYSMKVLNRFMHEPRQPHMAATLRVVRYLKSATGQGLLLQSNDSLNEKMKKMKKKCVYEEKMKNKSIIFSP